MVLAATLGVAAAPWGVVGMTASEAAADAGLELPAATEAVTPFTVRYPDSALTDLRRRLAATRWPERETVPDQTQGAPLERVRKLVTHWAGKHDWRRVEKRLNGFGNFRTKLDGLGIHFLHVRSKHKDALPLLLTHGWPGSVLEFADVIGPLTDPPAYGGSASDAFHVVVPSLPGYGFSDKPTENGWAPGRTARAWTTLMARLGYSRWVAQGGDWGGVITSELGKLAPAGLAGIHLNFWAEFSPPDLPDPTPEEQEALRKLQEFSGDGFGYFSQQSTRPQTLGYGLHDSPVGQAAWIYEKFAAWSDSAGAPENVLGLDKMLDDITLYWLTGTATSSARFYWQATHHDTVSPNPYSVPVGFTTFPAEIVPLPRRWAEATYGNQLISYTRAARGGHFAAFEQPAIFTTELRTWSRLLR